MIRFSRVIFLSALSVLTSHALAQAPVTDISSSQRRQAPPSSPSVEDGYPASTYPASTYPADFGAVEQRSSYPPESSQSIERPTTSSSQSSYRQPQQMEEDVAALRGEVEELRHAVKQLQQDMLTLSRNQNSTGGAVTASPATTPTSSAAPSSSMTSEGKTEYETAYNKLKNKDHDGAVAGFKSVVAQYPNSEYAGSSDFWLGFVYQTKGDTDNAIKAFSTLIDTFPNHNKAPDAKYNLGKLYHQQGNTTKAKELLKDVASGSSKSAPLAKSYLESMQ